MIPYNPRFPDTVRITREAGYDPFTGEEGTLFLVYEGKCSDERNLRTFTRDGVLVSTRVLQIPVIDVVFEEGDRVEITRRTGEVAIGVVKDKEAGNLGSSVFWEGSTN